MAVIDTLIILSGRDAAPISQQIQILRQHIKQSRRAQKLQPPELGMSYGKENRSQGVTQWVHPERISTYSLSSTHSPLFSQIITIQLEAAYLAWECRRWTSTGVAEGEWDWIFGCWQQERRCVEGHGWSVDVGVENIGGWGNEFARFFGPPSPSPSLVASPLVQSLRGLDSSISSLDPLTDCFNIYTGG